ncbi:hypothetical protein [Aurantiacibacter gilvus]|uniref:Secreted protein n=1 Tax=Aurantiacibacter gilvus TaxID=3139141 RepID=A0ABU9IBZ9_9SPHN
MIGLGEALALVALVPAMTGPVGSAEGGSRAGSAFVALCGGGTLVIPVDGQPTRGPATAPCCAKGCHSRDRRKAFDRKQ